MLNLIGFVLSSQETGDGCPSGRHAHNRVKTVCSFYPHGTTTSSSSGDTPLVYSADAEVQCRLRRGFVVL